MEKTAIVCALKDQASVNISKQLHKRGLPDWANYYEFDFDTTQLPLKKVKETNIIVLSKHASQTGTKSFTVHSLGNFATAELGGEDKTLAGALPRLNANYLRALEHKKYMNKLDDFTVCYEVTHHGPTPKKNICFIELGSTETEWVNETYARLVAEVVVESTFTQNKDKIVIGIGGGHYAPDFTKLSLRKKYSFGHICPQYALDSLDKGLLEQMITKTNAQEIVIDWKGLKGNKDKVVSLCERSGLPFERVQRLLKN